MLINGSVMKPGAAVIDVGINQLEDGRVVGKCVFTMYSLCVCVLCVYSSWCYDVLPTVYCTPCHHSMVL